MIRPGEEPGGHEQQRRARESRDQKTGNAQYGEHETAHDEQATTEAAVEVAGFHAIAHTSTV
ncbi:MAG: hypothetical protein OEX04_09080 [Acidimicrobiia bacterium]|nr:hypothetical protein [Acidimicrobiia bacterium]